MTADLTRPVPVSKIGPAGLAFLVKATPEECASVAMRMGIPAIQSLECRFDLTAELDGVTIRSTGRLTAQVTRICVVSVEEFDTLVEDDFEICFVPAGHEQDDPDPDQIDEVPYEAGMIDLGEATAEQLALALDPYPRIDGATMPSTPDDAEISPFFVLSGRARR